MNKFYDYIESIYKGAFACSVLGLGVIGLVYEIGGLEDKISVEDLSFRVAGAGALIGMSLGYLETKYNT